MRKPLALACLAAIAGADFVIKRRELPWLAVGPFDHSAHLATSALILLNLPPRNEGWRAGFMAGALLPDVDHIPLALRPVHPSLEDTRPMSHCLLAIAPVAAAAAAKRSEGLAGAAAGMLGHFARDLGVGTGVPLLWPLTRYSVRLPYPVYAGACVLLAWRAAQSKPVRPERDQSDTAPAERE